MIKYLIIFISSCFIGVLLYFYRKRKNNTEIREDPPQKFDKNWKDFLKKNS